MGKEKVYSFFLFSVIMDFEVGSMPELPEVETVKETLKLKVLHKKIKEVCVLYPKMIEYPSVDEFKRILKGKELENIERRGKWLLFSFGEYTLLGHLRMEGKFFLKSHREEVNKHEHVVFEFTDGTELRYQDTRKFGRMYLYKTEDLYDRKPLNELGLEPWDDHLNTQYLLNKYKKKRLPIKSVLLDQSIITGIGNIYADEILFLSHLNPLTPCMDLTQKDCENIIQNTQNVLERAIQLGGTTIRSYESSQGVHGLFQNELFVHGKEGENCPECGSEIVKIKVGGRGTYYCKKCQKVRKKGKKKND